MSNSVRPHRRQPTMLPRPWDSPGKNTGVGCHFLLQCMKVKRESEVAQSCPTLGDPMDCSPAGSSIHGIFQARVLEWGASAFSNDPFCSVFKTACLLCILCHIIASILKQRYLSFSTAVCLLIYERYSLSLSALALHYSFPSLFPLGQRKPLLSVFMIVV